MPLIPIDEAPFPAGRLNPIFDIEGRRFALQKQLMSAVSVEELGRPVGNLLRYYDRIVAAIDMIFNGF